MTNKYAVKQIGDHEINFGVSPQDYRMLETEAHKRGMDTNVFVMTICLSFVEYKIQKEKGTQR